MDFNKASAQTSAMSSPRMSNGPVPTLGLNVSPRAGPDTKLEKELVKVESEMYFMTKLEEVMWMCGSLMGMSTEAPLLYNHIMSYKDQIND